MSTYVPDTWVVIRFDRPGEEPLHKVFAGWYGGFAQGDSWKLNSGITKVTQDADEWYDFEGYSGSVYRCHPNNYRMSGYQTGIYSNWVKEASEKAGISIKILDLDEVAKL